MNRESKPLKSCARSEREELRAYVAKRAGEAPIYNLLDPESMLQWLDYVDEMREIENQLKEAGDSL
jgi:hypothetical protein